MARQIVPDLIQTFTCQLEQRVGKSIDEETDEKALLLVQHILYSICGIKTPLGIGNAFEIYNSTQSKAQISLMNRLNQSIIYDTFHHLLTSAYNSIISTIEDKGIYIPPNMRHGGFTQYAIDSIDWSEKNS